MDITIKFILVESEDSAEDIKAQEEMKQLLEKVKLYGLFNEQGEWIQGEN